MEPLGGKPETVNHTTHEREIRELKEAVRKRMKEADGSVAKKRNEG